MKRCPKCGATYINKITYCPKCNEDTEFYEGTSDQIKKFFINVWSGIRKMPKPVIVVILVIVSFAAGFGISRATTKSTHVYKELKNDYEKINGNYRKLNEEYRKLRDGEKTPAPATSAPAATTKPDTAVQDTTPTPTPTAAPVNNKALVSYTPEELASKFNNYAALNGIDVFMGKISKSGNFTDILTANNDTKISCFLENGYIKFITIDTKRTTPQSIESGLYYVTTLASILDPSMEGLTGEQFIADLGAEALDGKDHEKIKNGIKYILNINNSSLYFHVEQV